MSYPYPYNPVYECPRCRWRGTEDDMRQELEYRGTRHGPAEYSYWCPDCGTSCDSMHEVLSD